uniref:Phospholipase A2 n=1 Tax=Chelonoidis abingdonii TaxID=106734 RepID=A0A8C0QNQ1_CHEAB
MESFAIYLYLFCLIILNVVNLIFNKMIKQVTGKNALWNYSKYGCYCGSGGKGMPKDGTDQCCQLHDCCYHRLKGHGCNAKLNTYSYSYLSGRIYCGELAPGQKDGDSVLFLLLNQQIAFLLGF